MNHDKLIQKYLSGEISAEEFERLAGTSANGTALSAEDIRIEQGLSQLHYRELGEFDPLLNSVENNILMKMNESGTATVAQPAPAGAVSLARIISTAGIVLATAALGWFMLSPTPEKSTVGNLPSVSQTFEQPAAPGPHPVPAPVRNKPVIKDIQSDKVSIKPRKETPEKPVVEEVLEQKNPAEQRVVHINPATTHQETIRALSEDLARAEASQDLVAQALLSHKLGILYAKLNNTLQARKLLLNAADISRKLRLPETEAEAEGELALLDAAEGLETTVISRIERSIQTLQKLNPASVARWEKELFALRNKPGK